MQTTLPAIDYRKAMTAYKVALFLKSRNAQKVINALLYHGPMTVTDVYVKTRSVAYSYTSQVLNELERNGIVTAEKSGKNIVYKIVPERIESINEAIKNL